MPKTTTPPLQTEFDTATLPPKLQEAIGMVYEGLGVEPTAIRNPIGTYSTDLTKIAVYFGGLFKIIHDTKDDHTAINFSRSNLSHVPTVLNADWIKVAKVLLQGVTTLPPQAPELDRWIADDVEDSVGYALRRDWITARRKVTAWEEAVKEQLPADEVERVALAYNRWIDAHEGACRAVGATDELTTSVSWADTDNYEIGRGGSVVNWTLSLDVNPLGGGVLHLHAEHDDEDDDANDPDDDLKTKEGVLSLIEREITKREEELAALRQMRRAAQDQDFKYTTEGLGDDDEDEEDEEDDEEGDDEE